MNWVVRADPEIEDLIPGFLRNRRTELAALESALACSDYEFICRMAHTWKGICRPYGFVDLGVLSQRLEEAGGRGSSDETTAIIEQMREYLAKVQVIST
jgi:HPt (histidine-containing phosphotransfer) domain-containing protein